MAAVMIGWSPAAFAAPLPTSPYQSLPESRIPAAAVAGAMGMHFGGAMGTAVIMIPLVWVNELMGVRYAFPAAFSVTLAVVGLTAVPALFLSARTSLRPGS